jgi:hypothetical protein
MGAGQSCRKTTFHQRVKLLPVQLGGPLHWLLAHRHLHLTPVPRELIAPWLPGDRVQGDRQRPKRGQGGPGERPPAHPREGDGNDRWLPRWHAAVPRQASVEAGRSGCQAAEHREPATPMRVVCSCRAKAPEGRVTRHRAGPSVAFTGFTEHCQPCEEKNGPSELGCESPWRPQPSVWQSA